MKNYRNQYLTNSIVMSNTLPQWICLFDQVALEKNCLIILDIDDTVLNIESHVTNLYDSNNPQLWRAAIETMDVKLADENLDMFLTRAMELSCRVVYVSHRHSSLAEITRQQLTCVGALRDYDVHLIDGACKASFVKKMYPQFDESKIILIDDSIVVHDTFAHYLPRAKRYLFVKQ